MDGGKRWTQLRGGMPPTQVRDLHLQKRESDVVMATFGNGFWILDDYSPLREVSATTLAEEARLLPMRRAYQFQTWGITDAGSAGLATLGGNYTMPNPPYGATLTYHVGQAMPADTRLVISITDSEGRQVRRIDNLIRTPGIHRTTWNLTVDPPAAAPGAAAPAGRPGRARSRAGAGAPAHRACRRPAAVVAAAEARRPSPDDTRRDRQAGWRDVHAHRPGADVPGRAAAGEELPAVPVGTVL